MSNETKTQEELNQEFRNKSHTDIVGLRVVRGPDWQHGEQDKRGVGTVENVSCFHNWVSVKWDHSENKHGYQHGFDSDTRSEKYMLNPEPTVAVVEPDLDTDFKLDTPLAGYEFRDTESQEWVTGKLLVAHDSNRLYEFVTVDTFYNYCRKSPVVEIEETPDLSVGAPVSTELDLTEPFSLKTPVAGYEFSDYGLVWAGGNGLAAHVPSLDLPYIDDNGTKWKHCRKEVDTMPEIKPELDLTQPFELEEPVSGYELRDGAHPGCWDSDYKLKAHRPGRTDPYIDGAGYAWDFCRKIGDKFPEYTEGMELDLTEDFEFETVGAPGFQFRDNKEQDWTESRVLMAHYPNKGLDYPYACENTSWRYCRKVVEETKLDTIEEQFRAKSCKDIIGMEVVPGRDWEWRGQGGGTVGTVTTLGSIEGWVGVEWGEDYGTNHYQHGNDDKFDLKPAPGQTIPETKPKVTRPMTRKEAMLLGNNPTFFKDEDGEIWCNFNIGSEWKVENHTYCTREELIASTEHDFSDINWKPLEVEA